MANTASGFNLLPGAQGLQGVSQQGVGGTGAQQGALGLAQLSATGQMPSAADYQMRAGIQQAQAAAGAQAASTRGSLGLAGAQRAAQATQAGLAQQSVNSAAALRAQEQQAALAQYGALAGQQRQQDLSGDQLTLQQAQANAQLAQQQQLANQGMSGQLAGAAVGTAMKALPALAAFADMPIGGESPGYGAGPGGGMDVGGNTSMVNSALKNQTGSGPSSGIGRQYADANLGAPRDRNISTPDPLKRPDVAARRQQLQQQLRDLDIYESQQHPQLPAPQVNGYNDANITTSDPAKPQSMAGIREPVVASRGGFAERIPPGPTPMTAPITYDYVNPNPNSTRDWQERPFRPESGAPIRFADISPEESRALGASQAGAPPPGQYHDMPVQTSVLSEPGGDAQWTLREESGGPHHKSFIAAVDHQDHEVGKVKIDPLTPDEQKQVAAPHGAGPLPGIHGDMAMGVSGMAPAMKQRYGDMNVQTSDPRPGGQRVSPSEPRTTAAHGDTHQATSDPRPVRQYGDANLGKTASDIGDIWSNFGKPAAQKSASGDSAGAPAAKPEDKPDHEPIGNVASYLNADGTWTNDATPAKDAPAPGSALAKMGGPGNAWTDSQLRDAQGPGGYAQPYSPQSGAANDYPWASGNGRFSGPSEGPVAWKQPENQTNAPREPEGYKPGGLASLNYGPPQTPTDLVEDAKKRGVSGFTKTAPPALGSGTPQSVYNKYAKPVDTTPGDDSFLFHDETIGGAFDAAQGKVDAAREAYRQSQVAGRQAAAERPLLRPHDSTPSVSYTVQPGDHRALESLVGPSGDTGPHKLSTSRLADPAYSNDRPKSLIGALAESASAMQDQQVEHARRIQELERSLGVRR